MLEICTLGTGGTMPIPNRALSSVYVRCNGRSVLVDCGEGTQVEVQRLGWGIRCIDAILISHYHADHCSGLPGMLLALTKSMRTEPVHVYGPVGLHQVVSGLCVIAPQLSFPLVLHELHGTEESFEMIGLQITPLRLDHGMPCLGYRFHLPHPPRFQPETARQLGVPVALWKTLQRGEAVVHGGVTIQPEQVLGAPRRGLTVLVATDTRPVPAIVEMGQGSDLMILEGMYGADEKHPLALANHHMLFREAAELARRAGARRLALTHFSTSVEDPLEYLPLAQSVFPACECAADGMTFTLHFDRE